MLAAGLIQRAAWLLLLLLLQPLALLGQEASAAPAAEDRRQQVEPRQAAHATDPWVTVDEAGRPRTVTPVLTTVGGAPTLLGAAPHHVTETVFTKRPYGFKTTSTGAAQPVATNDRGAGAFAACRNTRGPFRPFCLPRHRDTYYPGKTHYITWDPAFFDAANTTVKILGFYAPDPDPEGGSDADSDGDTEADAADPSPEDEAFSSGAISAAWGFYQWRLDKSLLSARRVSAARITLRMAALPVGGQRAEWHRGPTVTVAAKPGPPARKSAAPDAQALFVALPTVLTVAVVMVVATTVWNRRVRRIGLGSVMSRRERASRVRARGDGGEVEVGGRVGGKKSRRSGGSRVWRMREGDKEETIRLMERDGSSSDGFDDRYGEDAYRDDLQAGGKSSRYRE